MEWHWAQWSSTWPSCWRHPPRMTLPYPPGSAGRSTRQPPDGARAVVVPRSPAKVAGPNPGNLAPRGRRRRKAAASPPLPLRACRGCGGILPVEDGRDAPRIDWCAECLPGRRQEIGQSMAAASQAAGRRIADETGQLPAHTRSATKSRSAGNARQREEQRKWAAGAREPGLDEEWYLSEVQPRLATFSLPAIAKATGASTAAASQWRSGKRVPHRRQWVALALLTSTPSAIVPERSPT